MLPFNTSKVPHHINVAALTAQMGFTVRVRSAGQKYGPTCHQRDRADVTEFVTLVRLWSLGQHVGVLALAGYKRRKSAPYFRRSIMKCMVILGIGSTLSHKQSRPFLLVGSI